MRIDFTIEGGRELAATLDGIAGRAEDTRPAWDMIADDFRTIQREMFATSGLRGAAAAWKPSSEAWLRRKAREGRSLRTLVFEGVLEKSLTRQGARYSRQRITRDSLTIGTSDPVVNLLAGKSGSRQKLPGGPRGLIGVNDRDRTRWTGILADHIAGARSGGLGL